MTVVCIIQAALLSFLAFCWHRQRAQLQWVDERDKLLVPIMDAVQKAQMLNVPIHGVDDIDGVYSERTGTRVPSKTGIEQMILVWDQVSTALQFQRREINSLGKEYGRLKNWELLHPVPGPRWVVWPYKMQQEGTTSVVQVGEQP